MFAVRRAKELAFCGAVVETKKVREERLLLGTGAPRLARGFYRVYE